ncbi:hypothetical protein OROMI_010201 [Orobanche minor]
MMKKKKVCKGHGMDPNVFTSYTEDNPGRRFLRCPMREPEDCKFFEWIEEELPPEYKYFASRVARKKNYVEAQLKESIRKVAILEDELSQVKKKLEILDEHNKELQNLNRELRRMNGGTWAMKKECYKSC